MENAILINAFYFLSYMADTIFSGLKLLVPFVLILEAFNVKMKYTDVKSLVITINILLLVGSIMFLTGTIINFYRALIAGDPMERDFMIGLATGPHWYQIVVPLLVYAIFPIILWIRKLRETIYSAGLIVLSWFIAFYFLVYLTYNEDQYIFKKARPMKFPIEITVEKALVFVLLLSFIYLILNFKRIKSNV